MVNPNASVTITLPIGITLDDAFKLAARIREVSGSAGVTLQFGQALLHVGKESIVCHNWPNSQGTREWKRKIVVTNDWVET